MGKIPHFLNWSVLRVRVFDELKIKINNGKTLSTLPESHQSGHDRASFDPSNLSQKQVVQKELLT